MSESSNKYKGMTKHIPDEYVAAWRDKDIEDLFQLLEKAQKSLKEVSTEQSRDHLTDVCQWLESYIEERMMKGVTDARGDLDVFT